MVYPAAVAKNAAPIDEMYARHSATISILDALFPRRVMEGAINPMIIRGTQKLISWPEMNFTQTMMLRIASASALPSAAASARPAAIPAISATSSLNGRL